MYNNNASSCQTGPCIDSDIGSDVECTSMTSEGEGGYLSDADSVCSASSDGLPAMFVCERCQVLARARLAEQEKSDSELEEERLENESRCAKLLMDGNYKCQCGDAHDGRAYARRKQRHKRAQQRQQQQLTSNGCHSGGVVQRTSSAVSLIQDGGAGAPMQNDGDVIGSNATNGTTLGNGQQSSIASLSSTVVATMPQDSLQPPGIIAMTECAICLESYKFGVSLCGLPCGHAFHQQCIMGWLQRDNHCCPVCRWPPYKAKPCSLHAHIE